MGMASHLGPWLLGTQKNTIGAVNATNVAAGQVRNMGATQVAQSIPLTYSSATTGAATAAFVLPAGAMVADAHILVATPFTGGTVSAATITLSVGATSITSAGNIFAAAGHINLPVATTAAAVNLWANVGTTDALVNYTITLTGTGLTAGSSYLVIQYIVRNADGSANPASV
jgi:hypothetical protein